MSILSTNNKIVRVGDAYSAGSGIDITDKVISVSDDLLNEISAISATVSSVTGDIGSQIDYISGAVNDLSGDIDYISANAGRTYSGIDPIVVNNDENKISAATLQLSAGDNITLTEEGNIVRIDGQAGGLTGEYVPFSATSIAIGTNPSARTYGFAQGFNVSAADRGLAQGVNVSAHDRSFAQGDYCSAFHYSIAQGSNSNAGEYSFAQGYHSYSTDCSLAQGLIVSAADIGLAQGVNVSAHDRSFAQGDYCSAFHYSIAQGFNVSASNCSQAFGKYLTITATGMAIGQYNAESANASFVIGNGSAESARSDSFIIYKDGSVSAAGKISANGVELGAGGGTTYTGDAQGALDEVYSHSGNWNNAAYDVSKIQWYSALWDDTYDEVYTHSGNWNSVYDTVSTASGSWTGGGGGSIDTIPFVVNSPLTTGFTGDSAYIGLEDLTDYAKNSAFTFKSNYLTGVSGNRVSAYRTYSAYTARNAYTAANAQNAQTAQTAYYDSNGGTLVAFPSTGVLETTSTYTLKWDYNSGYFWDKEGSTPTPTGTSLYPVIHYYCNQNSSGATISGSNINITVSCENGVCYVPTATSLNPIYLTAGQTTSFNLNGEINFLPSSDYGQLFDCKYSADNDVIADVNGYYNNARIGWLGKYNTINIEGNQVTAEIFIFDILFNTISSIHMQEASTFSNTYTIPDSIQGRTVAFIRTDVTYTTDWCSWTASKV